MKRKRPNVKRGPGRPKRGNSLVPGPTPCRQLGRVDGDRWAAYQAAAAAAGCTFTAWACAQLDQAANYQPPQTQEDSDQ